MERPIWLGAVEAIALENLDKKEQRLVTFVATKRGIGCVIATRAEDVDAVITNGAPKGGIAKVMPLSRSAKYRVEAGMPLGLLEQVTLGEGGTIVAIPAKAGSYTVLGKTEEPAAKGECPYFRIGLVTQDVIREEPKKPETNPA